MFGVNVKFDQSQGVTVFALFRVFRVSSEIFSTKGFTSLHNYYGHSFRREKPELFMSTYSDLWGQHAMSQYNDNNASFSDGHCVQPARNK